MGDIWADCVIDAREGAVGGIFTFLPAVLKADGSFEGIVESFRFREPCVPEGMVLRGVVHWDGEEALSRFMEEHGEAVASMMTGGMKW